MTSENYIILALIIGVIGFFWLITTMREKADQQQLVMEKMERLREARERREQNILLVYNALLSYAVKNGKVNYVAYDIEEGGQYLKEVNEADKNHLRRIVEEYFLNSDFPESKSFSLPHVNMQPMYTRVMNEMPKSKGYMSYGF